MITFICSLKAHKTWLQKEKKEREELRLEVAQTVDQHKEVKIEFLDADAFSGDYTDILILKTEDVAAYHSLWNKIKDHSIFTEGHYEIVDVRMGLSSDFI